MLKTGVIAKYVWGVVEGVIRPPMLNYLCQTWSILMILVGLDHE